MTSSLDIDPIRTVRHDVIKAKPDVVVIAIPLIALFTARFLHCSMMMVELFSVKKFDKERAEPSLRKTMSQIYY